MSTEKNEETKKECCQLKNERLDLLDNEDIIEKVKREGTITLDELIVALTKKGIKGIDFQDMSFNLEGYCLDKSNKSSFNKIVEESFDKDCINKIQAPIMDESMIDKDTQLLDVILQGTFEEEDICKLLALVDINRIKEYIISTLNLNIYDLKTYVHLLMDLRK